MFKNYSRCEKYGKNFDKKWNYQNLKRKTDCTKNIFIELEIKD